jgi:hypothetical protein
MHLQVEGPSNNALHLTAPLGAACARLEVAPPARPSASTVAAAERECSTNVVSILMALTGATYLVLCVTTAACGVSSGESLTFEVPAEFHGRVLVEYGVASCPYPETRLSRRVIRISGQGRGCSRGDTADSWAKWQFVYSGEGGRISGAPDDDRGLRARQLSPSSGAGWGGLARILGARCSASLSVLSPSTTSTSWLGAEKTQAAGRRRGPSEAGVVERRVAPDEGTSLEKVDTSS